MTAELASTLFPRPDWFAHVMDPVQDRILFVQHDRESYRRASFLDDRSLSPTTGRRLLPWSLVAQSVPSAARRDLQYIFHIGHVGSTLLARLLGELDGAFVLREPLLLRQLFELHSMAGRAECPLDPAGLPQRFGLTQALLSRTLDPGERTLVKATSFTSEIAVQLVPAGSAALLMYVGPQAYLENILAGDASRQEFQQLAGSRLARLQRRLGEVPARLWELKEGERAALGWACEMTSLLAAADQLEKTDWCDFDQFLAEPAAGLQGAAALFGLSLGQDQADRLCEGLIMTRYSKAPEHQYSPGLRRDVLAQSRSQNRQAIADGMAWLERLGGRYDGIGRALALANRERQAT